MVGCTVPVTQNPHNSSTNPNPVPHDFFFWGGGRAFLGGIPLVGNCPGGISLGIYFRMEAGLHMLNTGPPAISKPDHAMSVFFSLTSHSSTVQMINSLLRLLMCYMSQCLFPCLHDDGS